MTYSFPKLLETLAGGRGLVLATVVETDGSAPQVPGASAIFSAAGLEAGTVGGGSLEARVEEAARQALRDGRPRLVEIALDADPSDIEGAICGGRARVLVDPGVGEARAVFAAALEACRRRRAGVLAARIETAPDGRVAVERGFRAAREAGAPAKDEAGEVGGAVFGGLPAAALDEVLAEGRPKLLRPDGASIFIEPVRPLPRLIVAGAGHIGRAVARLGRLLDFSVTVIDDRAEFANAANVPDAAEIVVGGIGESVRAVGDAPDNYFVIVTRGHSKDAEALRAALGRPAAYVGMIGSRTKIGLMRREFLESGWATAEEWDRVRAPIGLDIGSKTVEEIAVSIAAELVRVRAGRRGPGRP